MNRTEIKMSTKELLQGNVWRLFFAILQKKKKKKKILFFFFFFLNLRIIFLIISLFINLLFFGCIKYYLDLAKEITPSYGLLFDGYKGGLGQVCKLICFCL